MKEKMKPTNPNWNSVLEAIGAKPKNVPDAGNNNEPATITMLPLARLRPFREHPYQVREDAELIALSDSIEQNGVLSPILVRPLEGTNDYEIISGHRRAKAAELAGLTEVPVIVADIDRDAAIVQMVDSNLHREHLLPSEKAFAYKMKLEAMKHQGKRGNQSFSQNGKRSNSYEELAETVGESRNQIHRYIRLTNLIPELLDYMDRGEMALTVGEALSYLDEEMQYAVLEAMGEQECTPSLSQACRMKKLFSDGQLTEDDIFDILAEEKANQREMVKIPLDVLQLFFPDYTPQQIRNAIVRMLEQQKKPPKRCREEER